MAIKIQGTIVIDDSKNLTNIESITFDDATVQTTAAGAGSGGTIIHARRSLLHTLDNPNAFGTSASDNFGYSVAVSGNYAIVGAYQEDEAGGTSSGKAYIFNVTTGALLHTLNNPNPSNPSTNDFFGFTVAISGNYAIVGAYGEDNTGANSGTAYIFNVTTGALLHTLNNPTAFGTSDFDAFGYSVAISSNYAIVGARWEDDAGGDQSGKAYIFSVTTGALVHTLDNPNAFGTSFDDRFGKSVAISGNYAIVGARFEDDAGGTSSGKAYIFNVTTGALLHTLDNPNAFGTSLNDEFGYSVSISGNYAIVGVRQEDDAGGLSSGKAYIFNVTTGTLLHTLDNPNAFGTSANDRFGESVSISGNYAIVGAFIEGDVAGSGTAYIFNVTTGALVHTIDNPNAFGTSASDFFGESVSISSNYAIIGAPFEDDAGGTDSGKAYIFAVSDIIDADNVEEIVFDNGYVLPMTHKLFSPSLLGGELVHTLDNPSPYDNTYLDNFGNSVAISGIYAIVGAELEDEPDNPSSGKAYIFNVITGALLHILDNPNAFGTSFDDRFGESVAISGNYAIVGAWNEDDAGGTGSGKAYIFNVTTGDLLHTLNNPNAFGTSASDNFSLGAVSISDNYAIVGAAKEYLDNSTPGSGKAYIFNVTTGALVRTLNNPNPFGSSVNDWFGATVAISGNYAIIGSELEDDASGTDSGAAFIFNVTTGALLHTLVNPNPFGTSALDAFATAVAISGNYAIVGAHQEDDAGGNGSGKAYIYNVTTGDLLHTLDNPNAFGTSANDLFGYSVAISGNYAIVGAWNEDDAGGTGSGKAYIFNVTTGALVHTIDNPNAFGTSASDNFGTSIAISGNYAIVGAQSEDDAGNVPGFTGDNAGKAYIFSVTDQTVADRLLTLAKS